MAQAEASPRCVGICPYYRAVQGSCDHELRSSIASYLREHPGEPCPVYEEVRAREMRDLAERLEREG